MSTPAVTIAVVSWNTRERLAESLDGLRESVDSGLAEVVVVDNDSSDGSADLVRDRFDWARLIESGANLGFGRAVNLGASDSHAEWIGAVNADTAPEPGAVQALLAAGAQDQEAAVLAPRLLLEDGSTQHSVHRFPTVSLALLNGLGARHIPPLAESLALEGAWNPERPRRVDWAHGAFLLIRRQAFEQVGGFDPGQWMYAEDLDLCWRLEAAGGWTRYVPEAKVRHVLSASTIPAFGEKGRSGRWMAASYAWMSRRRGRTVAISHAVVSIAGPLARAVLLAIPARLAGGDLAYRYTRARRQAALHRIGLRPGAAIKASEPPGGTLPPTDGPPP